MSEDERYLRDQEGNIMKDASGNPMPLAHFENDTTGEHWEEVKDEPAWMSMKRHLDSGGFIPEDRLLEVGFKKVNGKWLYEPS